MTKQTHTVSTDALATLGTAPIPKDSGRDAIHLAVEPVMAGERLRAGENIILKNGLAFHTKERGVGIVDPFLQEGVEKGDRFWLVVHPRTITSLRHVWSHPNFPEAGETIVTAKEEEEESEKNYHEQWMMKWAKKHISFDWGNINDDPHVAYEFAINMGHSHSAGSNMSVNDYIDDEWWDHWEAITGAKGERDTYFSCSC